MMDKPSICIWFSVNVINCIQSILKTFINSNSVIFGFIGLISRNECFIKLSLLVYLT